MHTGTKLGRARGRPVRIARWSATATIALNDQHLAAAGPTGRNAAAERMDGAGWIDVEPESYPPGAAGWVIVPPPGRGVTADTPEWRGLWHRGREGCHCRAHCYRRAVLTPLIDGAMGAQSIRVWSEHTKPERRVALSAPCQWLRPGRRRMPTSSRRCCSGPSR